MTRRLWKKAEADGQGCAGQPHHWADLTTLGDVDSRFRCWRCGIEAAEPGSGIAGHWPSRLRWNENQGKDPR